MSDLYWAGARMIPMGLGNWLVHWPRPDYGTERFWLRMAVAESGSLVAQKRAEIAYAGWSLRNPWNAGTWPA